LSVLQSVQRCGLYAGEVVVRGERGVESRAVEKLADVR
jgi:hypothetical protein